MSSPVLSIVRLALIGGSSFLESASLRAFSALTVDTPFGPVSLWRNADHSVYFVQRHAANPEKGKEYSPPHLINYRAIAKALQQLVRRARNRQTDGQRAHELAMAAASSRSRSRSHCSLVRVCCCLSRT